MVETAAEASQAAAAGNAGGPPATVRQPIIQKAIHYIVDFVVALKFSILVVVQRAMFDRLDEMPDVKKIQKQFLYVLSAFLFVVSLIALVTVDNYADNAIDTIRDAVCDRLVNTHSSCFTDGYVHLLNVEKSPSVEPEILGALVQGLWEALSLSQSIKGYAPWSILPKIFDYVVLPWVMPMAAGFIVWAALSRQGADKVRRERIKRYVTHLMMACVAVPLLLVAPVQALNKTFAHAEQNFPISAGRLKGPGYSYLNVGGKDLDEVSAIVALQDLVYRGGRTTRLMEYALYSILAVLCVRMVILMSYVIGRKSIAITGSLVGIFAIVMALVL